MMPVLTSTGSQRGIALAVVVWFIAGMSLLVAGIVASSRGDVRLAQVHAEKAIVTAASDGAIALLLGDLIDDYFAPAGQSQLAAGAYEVGPHSINVVAVPISWLVDINAAPEGLLAQGMAMPDSITPDIARRLALAVVQWRSGDARSQRFSSTEDLLHLAGIDRATLDGLRDFLAEPAAGPGLSQPGAIAQSALAATASLAPARRVAAGESRFSESREGISLNSRANVYRVDALVKLGGKHWLRRRWVSLGGSLRGAPWRNVRTEPVRVVGA